MAEAGAAAAEATALAEALTVGVPMNPAVREALPELVERVQDQVNQWVKGQSWCSRSARLVW